MYAHLTEEEVVRSQEQDETRRPQREEAKHQKQEQTWN